MFHFQKLVLVLLQSAETGLPRQMRCLLLYTVLAMKAVDPTISAAINMPMTAPVYAEEVPESKQDVRGL